MAETGEFSPAKKLDFMMEQAAMGVGGQAPDGIIAPNQGNTPKRARLGASPKSSPVLGKRKLAPEEPIALKQNDYLASELLRRDTRIRQLEAEIKIQKAEGENQKLKVRETEQLLKDTLEELGASQNVLEDADKAISVRDQHIRNLTIALHEAKQKLQAANDEIMRLRSSLDAERRALQAAAAAAGSITAGVVGGDEAESEEGALAVKSLQYMAQVVAFEEAQKRIEGLEHKLEEVAATRKMEAQLRTAIEDALIQQQQHYIMRLTQLENAKIERQRAGSWSWASCWCWR